MLYLFCGKMAAGKSTFASDLSQRNNLLLLSEDDMLGKLYPAEIVDVPGYVSRSGRLKSTIENLIVQLLSGGASIAMDFPANTESQRAWLINLAQSAGAGFRLYYFEVSDTVCKARLRQRAAEHPQRAATDTVEMFDAITRFFEAPDEINTANIVRVNESGNIDPFIDS